MTEITDARVAEIAAACSQDEAVVRAYIALGITASNDANKIAEEIEEAYCGQFQSDEEFAQDMVDNLGVKVGRNEPLEWPMYCIDWEWAARELMMDYSEESGHYFRNI